MTDQVDERHELTDDELAHVAGGESLSLNFE
jgi:bacteriocin-like protein